MGGLRGWVGRVFGEGTIFEGSIRVCVSSIRRVFKPNYLPGGDAIKQTPRALA